MNLSRPPRRSRQNRMPCSDARTSTASTAARSSESTSRLSARTVRRPSSASCHCSFSPRRSSAYPKADNGSTPRRNDLIQPLAVARQRRAVRERRESLDPDAALEIGNDPRDERITNPADERGDPDDREQQTKRGRGKVEPRMRRAERNQPEYRERRRDDRQRPEASDGDGEIDQHLPEVPPRTAAKVAEGHPR